MPTSWVLAPYKRKAEARVPTRYCAMDDFSAQIQADGGEWAESEFLGDQALVRVRAEQATLDQIAGTPGFAELPRRWQRLADDLSTMTNGERNQIQSHLLAAGYAQAEIDAAMGSTLAEWQAKSLNDLLTLITSRRLKPRYEQATDSIVLDGPEQPTVAPATLAAQVPEA
jgi:hypothetical protein